MDCTNGYGKCKWEDGETYEGEWKDDKRHGKGHNVYPDGKIKTGKWIENIFVDT